MNLNLAGGRVFVLEASLKERCTVLSVPTMKLPWNTTCGVRWVFVVVFACLSNVAAAGFVSALPPAPPGVDSKSELSDWLRDFLRYDKTNAGGSTEIATMAESSEFSHPSPDVPRDKPRFLRQRAVLGDCGSSGNPPAGRETTSGHLPLLPSPSMHCDPLLVSRLDAGENVRLPLKLPYKLFRPPKFT